jgi:hypothetical protein
MPSHTEQVVAYLKPLASIAYLVVDQREVKEPVLLRITAFAENKLAPVFGLNINPIVRLNLDCYLDMQTEMTLRDGFAVGKRLVNFGS